MFFDRRCRVPELSQIHQLGYLAMRSFNPSFKLQSNLCGGMETKLLAGAGQGVANGPIASGQFQFPRSVGKPQPSTAGGGAALANPATHLVIPVSLQLWMAQGAPSWLTGTATPFGVSIISVAWPWPCFASHSWRAVVPEL